MKKILLAITLLALLSLSAKAQPGAALNFVGTSSNYISVSTNTNIPIGNAPYTMEAWIQPLGSPANLGIVGWGNWGNTNQVNALRLDGTGGIYNYWWGQDLYAAPSSGFNLFDGNWHHVAATYDGTTRAIYVDGILKNSDTPTPAAINSPNNLTVGATDITGYFNGNIDEVRIWSRGLCQAEIQHNLNGELAASQTGLVAYYKFNEGIAAAANPTVTSLTDASGNSNTGTLNNFALTGTTSNWIATGAVTTGNILTAFTNTLSAVTTQTNITTCFGSTTGTASVTASGSGTFTYSWSPIGGTSSSATGLAAGNYTCAINNGCGTIAKTFTITQPTAISATTSSTNVSCFGGSNGAAGVNASGGTPGYTYAWAPSGGTSSSATGLTVGNYTCTITDAHSCTATKVVAVSGPSAAISATTSSTSVSCFGGSNGTAGVSASGGTSPYTYAWAPSGGTGATATGLTAGNYTCTITDAHSCTATKVVAVSGPSAAISATTSSTSVSCFSGSNGAAGVNASGGTSPYTYSWAPSGGTGATATGLTAGNYTCTITDAHSCTATKVVAVSGPSAAISATTSSTSVSCFSGSNGAAGVNASGGTSPYTYSWAPSGGTGATATGLTAGNYTCTITDAHSCTATKVVAVSGPSAAISATTSSTSVSCFGGSNGTAGVSASGGTSPYTYSWAPSGGTGATATGLTAGNYTCTITDANSCTTTKVVVVSQPALAISATTSSTSISCFGGSNGAAGVNASGGTPGYTYAWAPSGGTGATATGLTAGNYTCTITDAHSCTATKVVAVTQPTAAVSATTSTTSVSFFGGSNGTAGVSASGGTPPYTYSWAPSGGTGATATGLTAGNYTCTITDSHSCTTAKTLTVTQPSPAGAALNFDGVDDYVAVPDNAALDFGLNDFTIEADFQSSVSQADYTGVVAKSINGVSDGYGGYQLVLVNNNIAAEFADNQNNFLGVSNGLQGTSILTDGNWHHLAMVVNRATNNIKLLVDGTVEADVTNPLVSVINVTNPIEKMLIGVERTYNIHANANIDEVRVWNRAVCQAEIQNNMVGEVAKNANGLVAYYKFNQGFAGSNNTAISMLADSSSNALNGTLNNFGLTGTISNFITPGAVTTGSLVAVFTNTLSAVATQTNVVNCYGDASGVASVAASGYLPYIYTWSTGSTTSNTATGLTAGNYTCALSNGCGTPIIQTFTITQPTQLMASSISGTIVCYSGATTVTVSATGGTTNYSGTGVVTSVTAGSYTYTVTDANSCMATTTITVTQPDSLVASSTSAIILCNGDATMVLINATGGTSPYTGTGTITNITAGTYTYNVSDANSCATTTTLTITEPSALTATASVTNPSCAGTCNGMATVTVSGGLGGYTYSWSSSASASSAITGLCQGTYTCTINDIKGCMLSQPIDLVSPPAISIASTQTNVTCNGASNGAIALNATGGTPAYSYSWSPSGGVSSTESNLSANNYTVMVTDANGCTSVVTFTVTQPNAVDASVNVSGGTITANNATATYQWVDCNNSNAPISGATSQSFSPLSSGNYAVIVTEGASCSATSTCTPISTTGIAQNKMANSISVYPNPFSNELTIVSSAKTSAMLFDMLGNQIKLFDLQSTTQTISLGELAPGIYYLQVDAQKIKIVKQ